MTVPIQLSAPVRAAKDTGRPICALESNVIAHGFGHPVGLEVANRCEAALRSADVEPATVFLKGGRIHLGATAEDLEAHSCASDVAKISARDMPMSLASQGLGATSVAATAVAAALIAYVASAGVGGVHRGAGDSFDISPDLQAISRSGRVVFCAGFKNFLDIGATLEVLETLSCPVITYGTDDFPAFFCTKSGHRSPHRVDDAAELRAVIDATKAVFDGRQGVIVAIPPASADALPFDIAERAVADALAGTAGTGAALTKAIMRNMEAASNGRTREANIATVIHNAAQAGRIIAELSAASRNPGLSGHVSLR